MRKMTVNVNSEVQLDTEVNNKESDLNVNLKEDSAMKLTLRKTRLGRQKRDVLLFLFKDKERAFTQIEIIKGIYGEVTPSRKASMSRTTKALTDIELVGSHKAVYSNRFSCWLSCSVHYFITEDKGEKFVEDILRGRRAAEYE